MALGLPLVVYLMQDSLIFHPQPLERSHAEAMTRLAHVERVFIQSADGVRLHAWHVKGVDEAPLVIYFGGNAEGVSWMIEEARQRTPRLNWLLVDYRGYGGSEGSPSEAALTADALAWYDKFSQSAKTIFVFGRSLGSAVAVQLAAHRPVAGAILVAPFDSMNAVAKRYYPYLPVDLMLKHRFDSVTLAPKIAAPMLCIVAGQDEVIPVEHARRLYAAWGGRKQWVELAGATHNSTDDHAKFWPSIAAFLTP